jgi:hypothetical protein
MKHFTGGFEASRFRGWKFSWGPTLVNSSCVIVLSAFFLGTYWHKKPLKFSSLPRFQLL